MVQIQDKEWNIQIETKIKQEIIACCEEGID